MPQRSLDEHSKTELEFHNTWLLLILQRELLGNISPTPQRSCGPYVQAASYTHEVWG